MEEIITKELESINNFNLKNVPRQENFKPESMETKEYSMETVLKLPDMEKDDDNNDDNDIAMQPMPAIDNKIMKQQLKQLKKQLKTEPMIRVKLLFGYLLDESMIDNDDFIANSKWDIRDIGIGLVIGTLFGLSMI